MADILSLALKLKKQARGDDMDFTYGNDGEKAAICSRMVILFRPNGSVLNGVV